MKYIGSLLALWHQNYYDQQKYWGGYGPLAALLRAHVKQKELQWQI